MPRRRNWRISEARRVVLQGKVDDAVVGRRAVLGRPNGGQQAQPKSPVIVQAESPVIVQAESPVIAQAQSPVIAQAESPVIVQAQSPVIAQAQSPVIVQAESPVIAQAQSPVIAQAESPVVMRAESPVVMRALCTNCKCTLLNENENATNMLDNNNYDQKLSDSENIEFDTFVLPSKQCCETSRSFGCKVLIHGSFHQGDNKFTFESRGSQCTMNSLCSLVYAQYSSLSTKENLYEVLVVGDQLYKTVVKNLKQKGKYKHRLLCLDEIPDQLNLLSNVIQVEKRDIISGVAIEQFGDTELPTLHQSLHTAFQSVQHVMVMIGAICSAVYVKDDMFWLFDSHSHGNNGLSSVDGHSVLMSFNTLDDLVTFMYALYDSMQIDLSSQYELLPVKCTVLDSEKSNTFDLLTEYFDDQKNKMMSKLNKQIDSQPPDTHTSEGEWTVVRHKKQERREYFKNYRQTKRTDQDFKLKEREMQTVSKQKARANPKFKENEKESQKTSKRKSRADANFKTKELEHRKNVRLDPEFKEKEKDIQKKSKSKARQDSDFKAKEKAAQIASKRKARQDSDFKAKEKAVQIASKKKARADEDFRAKEEEHRKNVRLDPKFNEKEKEIQKTSKKKARADEDFRAKEVEHRKNVRLDPKFKEKEKDIQKKSKSKARQDSYFKAKEKADQIASKRKARQDSDFKAKEKTVQIASKKKARADEDFRAKEVEHRKNVRLDPKFKEKEKEIQKTSKKKARADENFRAKEIEHRKNVRLDPKFKEKEKEIQKTSKRKARADENYKMKESEQKKKLKLDPKVKEKEKKSQRASKTKARKDPYVLEKERITKQMSRSCASLKQKEIASNRARKTDKRKSTEFNQSEMLSVKRRKYGSNIDECVALFHKSIEEGPQYICTCCKQTWFQQSVSNISNIKGTINKQFLTGTLSVRGLEWICITCKTSLLKNQIPILSLKNGMMWPEQPKELHLFPLEERLISLRIPFMQIRELPRGRQYSVKGNVVNVPVDIQPAVDALPRTFDENITVAVKLKRKLSHKSCAFTENVRPLHVLTALHWLKRNSDLYKNSAVTVDEEWANRVTADCEDTVREFFSTETNCDNTEKKLAQNDIVSEYELTETCDSDEEENVNENVGNIDTLIDAADIENRANTLTFAPGEGQRPLGLYQDPDAEFLCFPSIFCGQRRIENKERLTPVSYSDIVKWELRSSDRRAANSVPNIFFKMKKIQMKQLNDKVNLAVRRGQFGDKKLTAGQAKDSSYMEGIVKKDEGYYIFKQLRNSPSYLEARKKDVFAMIRQLGLPTWFMSLSSADTRWPDLLNMLSKLNTGTEYTELQISNMTWEQKIKLIQKDPVTCSRYFDHRVQQFIKIVLKSPHEFLGKVKDYFYRVEFQQRGSPHIHMLVWVEDAPKHGCSAPEEITAYVDRFLKCSLDNDSLQDLIQLQIHKHSRTCHKKADRICRFGYPLPPLNKTMVLDPLETEVDKYKKMYEKMQKSINAEKEGFDMAYEEFLTNVVKMTEEDYIKCIRSSLRCSKVFLERRPKDIRVNFYNEAVLQAWKANIDIQFVLDPYACAMYIVSYISKSQRGMSTLLHAAAKEARNGNLDVKRQVRHIGNVFSNSVEVSAQEAVYLVLQMPLTRSTRDVVFINTSPPNQRIQLLKAKSVLDELPESSTDIVADNMIKRYAKRPNCLEHWCLADYISQLDIIYPKRDDNPAVDEERNDDDVTEQDIFDEDQTILVLKSGVKIRKRQNFKVIRYVRFNHKSDEENHFREKLLLFLPWRNETDDLIAAYASYKEHYIARKNQIDSKCKLYEHHVEELEMAHQIAEQEYDAYDDIAPETQQMEAETAQEDSVESETFVYFNPDRAIEHREYDIAVELGCSSASASVDLNDNVLSDEEYRNLLRCLNSKQRHFYNHVIHWIKTKDAPLYAFLTGGAGVGKSVVIKALYQTLYRFLNLSEGENADEKRILLCAYTGKAAYNINGSTISTAFNQKFKQKVQTLNCDNLNTFRSKYRNLSVIIIDEISMVSNTMLKFIDQRLQELTGTRIPFGGKTIIAVGDLYQLKPVAGSWIFQDPTSDASALDSNLWQDHFTMFELTEIMRQKDDANFAELLNRLRHNKMTEHDYKQIEQCHVDSSSDTYPLTAPHIFAENCFMQSFNDKMINNLNAEKVEIGCHDSVVGANISQERQKRILEKLPQDSNATMGLHHSLTVVVGMIYDLTVNIDTEDGLTNGASCVVKYIEYKQAETNRPSIIWVKFDDPHVGKDRRQKYYRRGFYHDCIDEIWTPVFDIERTFTMRQNTVKRIQFPLQPSAGRTVHRAQGTTLDQVVIDLSQRRVRKNPHIHYVALSRVRCIENLHILNFNANAVSLDEKVEAEMDRLDSEAKLKLCYIPLDTVESTNHFKIVYNNSRSVHRHFQDVSCDQNILSAHIIGLAETRLVHTDENQDYSLNGFQLIRNDQKSTKPNQRPPHGLAVYIKDGVCVIKQHCYSTTNVEWIVLDTVHEQRQMQVVMLYKSPKLSFNNLKTAIEKNLVQHLDTNKPLVIMGDFNIDILQKDPGLTKFMAEQCHCKQLVQVSTTDQGSTLDLVFANCSGTAGSVETYWSDHKMQEKLIAALKEYYDKEARSKAQTPKTPKVNKSNSRSSTPALAAKKVATPVQNVPNKKSALQKKLTPAKTATPKPATPAAKVNTPVRPRVATPVRPKVATPVGPKVATPVRPKVATPVRPRVASPVKPKAAAVTPVTKSATPKQAGQGTPASNKGASRWEKKVWKETPELKKGPGSGKRKQADTPEAPSAKKRRSTFETAATPELCTPVVDGLGSSGRRTSRGARRSTGSSPGVKVMLSSMKPEMSSTEMKQSLLSAIDKKVQDKAKNAPSSVSSIPRFAAFLKKRDEAKPVTPGNKDWNKIHKKTFDKFDSIDVYLEKKRKRAEEITASVKKARHILEEVHTAVDKLKAHKTPKGVENKKPRYSNPNRTTPFKPTVLSTSGMNFNFGVPRSPKTMPRKSPKSMLSTTKTANSTQIRKSVGSSVTKKPAATPFKFTALNATTIESTQKQKFDLKASLARPITWKTHKGKLKPLVPEAPVFNKTSEVKAKKTRHETRKNLADRRANNKNKAQMARRGINV